MAIEHGERHVPDPGVLERAMQAGLERVREHTGELDRPVRWELGARIDRRQTVVFPLRLICGNRTCLRAFYKAHIVTGTGSAAQERAAWVRWLLARSGALASQFEDLAAGSPVAMPAMLAADADALVEVTTAVPGHALGPARRWAIPGRRSRALRLYARLGHALGIVERCTAPGFEAGEPPPMEIRARVARLAGVLTTSERDRLAARLRELRAATLAESPSCYAHGDVSAENVLVDGERVGIIDANWPVRWPGYDVAKFAVRLDFELPSVPRWNARLVRALLRGYGDEVAPERPAWELTRLWQLTALAAGGGRSAAARARRSRALRSLTGDGQRLP